jgi:hypothetical protein
MVKQAQFNLQMLVRLHQLLRILANKQRLRLVAKHTQLMNRLLEVAPRSLMALPSLLVAHQ